MTKAAVIGITDELRGEAAIPFVMIQESLIPSDDRTLLQHELMSFVNDQVAEFKRIRRWTPMMCMLLLSIGKTDRKQLRRLAEAEMWQDDESCKTYE